MTEDEINRVIAGYMGFKERDIGRKYIGDVHYLTEPAPVYTKSLIEIEKVIEKINEPLSMVRLKSDMWTVGFSGQETVRDSSYPLALATACAKVIEDL